MDKPFYVFCLFLVVLFLPFFPSGWGRGEEPGKQTGGRYAVGSIFLRLGSDGLSSSVHNFSFSFSFSFSFIFSASSSYWWRSGLYSDIVCHGDFSFLYFPFLSFPFSFLVKYITSYTAFKSDFFDNLILPSHHNMIDLPSPRRPAIDCAYLTYP